MVGPLVDDVRAIGRPAWISSNWHRAGACADLSQLDVDYAQLSTAGGVYKESKSGAAGRPVKARREMIIRLQRGELFSGARLR